MSQQRKGGLGRGLAALIPTGPDSNGPGLGNSAADVMFGEKDATSTPSGNASKSSRDRGSSDNSMGTDSMGAVYREIPQREIQPNPQQPRTVFDEDALNELVHSLREFGLMQPIVVRRLPEPIDQTDESGEKFQIKYQLVMGERRWRASQTTVELGDRQIPGAGLAAIPAIVRETADGDMLRDALLENIHRAQLNPLEEAAAYQQLLEEFGVTHEQLADRLGRSRPVISNMIRLLNLPVPVQRRVAAGVLSAGHARALLSLKDEGQSEELAARIVKEGLSVRATEEAVTLANRDGATTTPPPVKRKPMQVAGLQEVADSLSDRLDTRVTVSVGKRKGKMVIEFGSVGDLERIVGLINKK